MGISVLLDGVELERPYEVRVEGVSEDEFFRDAPDSRVCELVDGVMIVGSPADAEHQDVAETLCAILKIVVKRRGLGVLRTEPFPMRLAEGLVREPDLFVVRPENVARIARRHLEGPADLVIEVVSDSRTSRHRELVEKVAEYDRHGVGEYWAIDRLAGQVAVFARSTTRGQFERRDVASGQIESVAVPGLAIDAGWVLGPRVADADDCLAALGFPVGGPPAS